MIDPRGYPGLSSQADGIFGGLGLQPLNGKVERSQRTDLEEFYASVNLRSPDLEQRLEQWQDYYNQERPHGSLSGLTPWERWHQLIAKTPLTEEVEALYDPAQERIRYQNYRVDGEMAKVKPCL